MYQKNNKKWVALFIGPALFFLTVYLIYPSIQTFIFSFMGRRSEEFVGLENFIYAFTSRAMLTSFRNNLMWIIFFTSGTVILGLLMAILVDKVKYEKDYINCQTRWLPQNMKKDALKAYKEKIISAGKNRPNENNYK